MKYYTLLGIPIYEMEVDPEGIEEPEVITDGSRHVLISTELIGDTPEEAFDAYCAQYLKQFIPTPTKQLTDEYIDFLMVETVGMERIYVDAQPPNVEEWK
jgi:hypothetical protein